jgi:pyridoxamine 5'-phosphate oxidase
MVKRHASSLAPIEHFQHWYDEAVAAGVRQPDAMTLATVQADGTPNARTVLLRGLDERGFAFYTNFESAKGEELTARPYAALTFHWREQERQVRVRGPVARVADDVADRYWASRPRGHQLSAWASPQSRVVDEADLVAAVAELDGRYAGEQPPRPPFWGGFVVAVDELELWQGRPDRLHERRRFRRSDGEAWIEERLAP